MALAGKLTARLGLDSSQFNQGMGRAKGSVGAFAGAMRSLIGPLAAGMAAAFSTRAIKNSMAQIDAQAKLAKSLGTTVASMQVLERAGALAGVGMNQVEKGAKDLFRRLSQAAEGTGPAKDALKQLGLSATEMLKLPLDQRIEKINAAIASMVPKAQQAAVASKLFGEEGGILMSRLDPATIRQASEEIRQFGYAISDTDAGKIEQANDAISKLGLIGSGLVNALTVALAPALNAMAQGFASLMRDGGALRNVLGVLGGAFELAADSVKILSSAVSWLFTSMSDAVSGSVISSLITNLQTLVSWAGEFISKISSAIGFFADLVSAAGGFGEALALLGPLASEVWDRIKTGGDLMRQSLSAGALQIRSAFVGAFATIVEKFAAMTQAVADGWNWLMTSMGLEGNASGMGEGLAGRLRENADALGATASAWQAGIAKGWKDMATAPILALEVMRDKVKTATGQVETSLDDAGDAADDFGADVIKAGGGGSAAMEKTAESVGKVGDRFKDVRSTMKSSFVALASGAKTLREALADVLGKFRDMIAERLFDRIFDAGRSSGGFLSNFFKWILPKNAAGTPNFAGGLTQMNELGGELAILPGGSRIIPHDLSKRMVDGGNGVVDVRVFVDQGGNWQAAVANISGSVSAQIMGAGMSAQQRVFGSTVAGLQARGTT